MLRVLQKLYVAVSQKVGVFFLLLLSKSLDLPLDPNTKQKVPLLIEISLLPLRSLSPLFFLLSSHIPVTLPWLYRLMLSLFPSPATISSTSPLLIVDVHLFICQSSSFSLRIFSIPFICDNGPRRVFRNQLEV